jgi:hypothetical protein
VDQALSILTGKPAGEKNSKGEFPKGSINRKVHDRLHELAESRRAFSKSDSKEDDKADEGKAS